MKNYNYVYNIQLNITIPRKDQQELDYEGIKEKVDYLSYHLFKRVNQNVIYAESHQFVINLIGEFEPYHFDRQKKREILMEYESSEKQVYGEINKRMLIDFENIELSYFVGQMNFKEFNLKKVV